MKILIAPDKFKGSLSAQEVCEAIGRGIKKSNPSADLIYHPMADGGDGSIAILSDHLNLKKHEIKTIDPIGREIISAYFSSSNAAFIEVASASGIVLLSEEEKNPMLTSTLGTGKMIADALKKGFQNIYLFLGGSATNDAGMGIASALGFEFLDEEKNELEPIGKNLVKVKFIKASPTFDFEKININLLCDVDNPMYGVTGAAHIYAPQKGADPKEVLLLDTGLQNFSNRLNEFSGIEVSKMPGGGAAGAIGAGLVALLNAKLLPGFDAIAQLTNLEKQIETADLVISGEGKLDEQSLRGKVIYGIAKFCKKHEKPFTLFVGKNELNIQQKELLGVRKIFSVLELAEGLEAAMKNGDRFLEKLAGNIMIEF